MSGGNLSGKNFRNSPVFDLLNNHAVRTRQQIHNLICNFKMVKCDFFIFLQIREFAQHYSNSQKSIHVTVLLKVLH